MRRRSGPPYCHIFIHHSETVHQNDKVEIAAWRHRPDAARYSGAARWTMRASRRHRPVPAPPSQSRRRPCSVLHHGRPHPGQDGGGGVVTERQTHGLKIRSLLLRLLSIGGCGGGAAMLGACAALVSGAGSAAIAQVPTLVTYGPGAPAAEGDPDYRQTILVALPEGGETYYLRLLDPATGSPADIIFGRERDTRTRFTLYESADLDPGGVARIWRPPESVSVSASRRDSPRRRLTWPRCHRAGRRAGLVDHGKPACRKGVWSRGRTRRWLAPLGPPRPARRRAVWRGTGVSFSGGGAGGGGRQCL